MDSDGRHVYEPNVLFFPKDCIKVINIKNGFALAIFQVCRKRSSD